jgi:hypothetical protein
MTIREQLTNQVVAIRDGTTTIRSACNGPRCGTSIWEIMLKYPCPAMSQEQLRWVVETVRKSFDRVNAAEVAGADAGHLLFFGYDSDRDPGYQSRPSGELPIWMRYSDRPWNPPGLTPPPYPEADFDELLTALDTGRVPLNDLRPTVPRRGMTGRGRSNRMSDPD